MQGRGNRGLEDPLTSGVCMRSRGVGKRTDGKPRTPSDSLCGEDGRSRLEGMTEQICPRVHPMPTARLRQRGLRVDFHDISGSVASMSGERGKVSVGRDSSRGIGKCADERERLENRGQGEIFRAKLRNRKEDNGNANDGHGEGEGGRKLTEVECPREGCGRSKQFRDVELMAI